MLFFAWIILTPDNAKIRYSATFFLLQLLNSPLVKPAFNATRRQLIEALQNQMIPWLGSGAPITLLDAPPHAIGPGTIHESPGKILPNRHSAAKPETIGQISERLMEK